MDITYNELRSKEVINIVDGRRLGRVCDLVISGTNCSVLGIVVPSERRIFKGKDDLFISFRQIKRIGDDCILVMLELQQFNCKQEPVRPKKSNCDYLIDDE
ncbi:MAG: YlmC/YmxH family sporulation protein [Clostridia bacterium]|nr:YlmC/YmxH family sporulation protein [Clostridia bacterium]